MTTTTQVRPKVDAEMARPRVTAGPTLQERIDALIAEAVKNAPAPLSVEEQRNKNQAAIEMLDQWEEEDKTNDPEEIARRVTEWKEFKKGINENYSSGRIVHP